MEQLNTKENKQTTSSDHKLSSQELYDAISSHPEWRICEYIRGTDVMRPLDFERVDEHGAMILEYDFASTSTHPHGLCRGILELVGSRDDVSSEPVYCDDFLQDSDGNPKTWYNKIIFNNECKWICLKR